MRNEPLDLSTVSLSLPRDLVLASAVQLLESHKMHSKWNLLQNLTRTIRQAGAREDGRSDRRGWMAGGWCRWCQRRRRRRQSRQRRVAHLKLPPKTRRRRRKGRREEGETDQLRIMPRGKNMDETTDATDGRHLVRGRLLTRSVGRVGSSTTSQCRNGSFPRVGG